MMKIGYFGGTFDPIHFGHLNLALELLEQKQLDQVLFCPTSLSPHKTTMTPLASAAHRLKMVQLAVAPVKEFAVLETEVHKTGPAYTIDTICSLIKPNTQLYLILGEDHLASLPQWKEVDELLKLAPPLVGGRSGAIDNLPPHLKGVIGKGLIQIPMFDISSTVIRQRLKQKQYCGHLIPAPVFEYIHNNQLYT